MNYSLMNRRKEMYVKPKDLVVFLISEIIGILFILFNTVPSNAILAVLPVVYGFGYVLFYTQSRRMVQTKTALIFHICEFLRMVVLVLVTLISGQYGFKAFRTNDANLLTTASLLMCYEYLIGSVVIYLYSARHKKDIQTEPEKVALSNGESFGIFLIVLLAIALFIALPEVRRQIHFLRLDAEDEKVRATTTGSTSSAMVLLLNFVHYAFLCIFVFVASWMYKIYNRKENATYYYVVLLAGLITIATIFGESRAALVYTTFAVFSCMVLLFPKFKKRTGNWLLLSMVLIFAGMTVYRLFFVYRYGSYADAILAGPAVGDNYYADFMESYLLGPQSVAAGIHLAQTQASRFTFPRLLVDLLRPFMGFNLLLKNTNTEMSTVLYNSMLSGVGGRSNGSFLQITAQGYCYFGFFLAPIFLVAFLLLAFWLEKRIAKSKSLFSFFFLNYMLIRIATAVLGGTMSGFITMASMLLYIMGFFWVIQKIFKDGTENTIRKAVKE